MAEGTLFIGFPTRKMRATVFIAGLASASALVAGFPAPRCTPRSFATMDLASEKAEIMREMFIYDSTMEAKASGSLAQAKAAQQNAETLQAAFDDAAAKAAARGAQQEEVITGLQDAAIKAAAEATQREEVIARLQDAAAQAAAEAAQREELIAGLQAELSTAHEELRSAKATWQARGEDLIALKTEFDEAVEDLSATS